MSEKAKFKFTSLADIARSVIENYPGAIVNYVGAEMHADYLLVVWSSDIRISDVAPYLPANISCCQGRTGYVIHFHYV